MTVNNTIQTCRRLSFRRMFHSPCVFDWVLSKRIKSMNSSSSHKLSWKRLHIVVNTTLSVPTTASVQASIISSTVTWHQRADWEANVDYFHPCSMDRRKWMIYAPARYRRTTFEIFKVTFTICFHRLRSKTEKEKEQQCRSNILIPSPLLLLFSTKKKFSLKRQEWQQQQQNETACDQKKIVFLVKTNLIRSN